MNGIQLNDKPRHGDKPVLGCLGRMVNLFDLTSLAGNHLLTDKPHNDGHSLSRSQSDVSRISSVARDDIQDKVMISESIRSSLRKKSSGTPVRMLIAQELSTELHSRHNSSNVVAKLMGLDAFPQQQRYSASQRSHSQCHRQSCQSEQRTEYWQEEHGFLDKQIDCKSHLHKAHGEYKDIFEIWQPSQTTNSARYNSPHKGRSNENVNEKKLALIRQKFMEVKRLSTDEELHQTKEFQEALDVLSSSGELFLKVLQEPNSFSEHLYVGQSISPPLETKRITVLRPSKKLVDEKFAAPAQRNEKPTKKQVNLWDNHNGFSPTRSTWKANDIPSQPTRIVVLRPSPMKVNDAKAITSSPSGSFFEGPQDGQVREAREVAKEITEQMRENLARHRRDETLLSSVFSNGYKADESSFEKSDNELAAGNLSDSDVMSPTARHSWDYVSKYSSPYWSSSLSKASYSPESSVCKEAKKWLSERWAMIASNGSSPEPRHARSSSGTLGEMLALSEMKKSEICEEENHIDNDPTGATCGLNSNTRERECEDDSLRNIQRLKSVPVSSIVYGERLDVQVSYPVICKDGASKEIVKTRSSKTSFAGKVTSLFFSRNKKSRKDKFSTPQLNDESQLTNAEAPGTNDVHSETGLPSGTVMGNLSNGRLREDFRSHQGRFCASESNTPENQRENQDQPSSISLVELPFEEDKSATFIPIAGKQMSLFSSESNLIEKSPPIGSIARTLSWEESYAETVANYPLCSPFVSPGAKNDKAEWLFLVQTLLSMADIDNESKLSTNLSRWHSPMSPLNPTLKGKYLDLDSKEPLHEAKRRQLRSNRKLVFDCVNAALVDITGMGNKTNKWVRPPSQTHVLDVGSTMLAQKVWAWMEECCLSYVKLVSLDGEDNHSLVEGVARKEVVGEGWVALSRLEMDDIGKEIEVKLLEELVEESVIEWTCRY